MDTELTEQARTILEEDACFEDDLLVQMATNGGTEVEAAHDLLVQRLLDWLDPEDRMSHAELVDAEAMIEAQVDWEALRPLLAWSEMPPSAWEEA